MIRSSGLLYTDKQGKEVREDSTVLFELSANDADTHQYVANCVPPHWHDELEIFWLMEGRVRVGIGEETHELQAGEGCLINAGVLHSVTGAVQEACRFRSFVFDASIVSGMPGGVFDVKYIRPLIEKGPTFLRLDLAGADTACLRAFQCAFDACEKEEPGFEFRVREALTEILLNVLKKCRLEPTRARPDAGESGSSRCSRGWMRTSTSRQRLAKSLPARTSARGNANGFSDAICMPARLNTCSAGGFLRRHSCWRRRTGL